MSRISTERSASSVTIPEMSPFLVCANRCAPTIPVKKPLPGESTRNSRSIDAFQSLAFTKRPSEYSRRSRSVNRYVLPSSAISGRSSASAGMSVVPSGPLANSYVRGGTYAEARIAHESTLYASAGSR